MVDFLISYNNNIAKIGKTSEGFKLRSFKLSVLATENNEILLTEDDAFLGWDQADTDSLVYRFLDLDILPSPITDVNRIIYGD